MFVLKKDPTVLWPVSIPVAEDGGDVSYMEVSVRYQLLPEDERDRLKGGDGSVLLKRVVVGWSEESFGQESNDGSAEPLPFNQENLNTLLGWANIRSGLLQGYYQAAVAVEKN